MTDAASRIHSTAEIVSPYDGCPVDITFFVSCYNEAKYIVSTLDTVIASAKEAGLRFEIIVIDDGSKDGSREIVSEYISKHSDENILLRGNHSNKGWAQNFVDAAFIGRGKYYRAMCGDNSETTESVAKVLREVGTADIIVPYYLSSEGKPLARRAISRMYTSVINVISGNNLHYYNGQAVHLRYNVMRWAPQTRGFGYQSELLCRLIDLGFNYREVAIYTTEKREEASNAVKFKNILSVMHTVLHIFARRISNWVYARQ